MKEEENRLGGVGGGSDKERESNMGGDTAKGGEQGGDESSEDSFERMLAEG